MEDPERFLKDHAQAGRLAIDEIHRLDNPSQLLKIAADYYPKGDNYVVCENIERSYRERKDDLEWCFVSLPSLMGALP